MNTYLVRYGVVPEVARFRGDPALERGTTVVVRTHRGLQLGTVLERERNQSGADDDLAAIERPAAPDDLHTAMTHQESCYHEFAAWRERISEWNLELELVDLEWTLERDKLILYVLTERGPETTKLALQAAAAGIGPIEVQPIAREGLLAATGHGCGSGGCGCQH